VVFTALRADEQAHSTSTPDQPRHGERSGGLT
jgi:hypothetical protein